MQPFKIIVDKHRAGMCAAGGNLYGGAVVMYPPPSPYYCEQIILQNAIHFA